MVRVQFRTERRDGGGWLVCGASVCTGFGSPFVSNWFRPRMSKNWSAASGASRHVVVTHNKNGPHKLLGAMRVLRIRVASAESRLKQLREQARQAKRRRKEAKRLAQRARKVFKRSKADVAALKQTLAQAEEKLFKAGGRALARKLAKGAKAAKASAPAKPKPRTPGASSAPLRPAKPVAQKQRAGKRINAVPKARAQTIHNGPKSSAPQPSTANTPIYEQRIPDQRTPEVEGEEV